MAYLIHNSRDVQTAVQELGDCCFLESVVRKDRVSTSSMASSCTKDISNRVSHEDEPFLVPLCLASYYVVPKEKELMVYRQKIRTYHSLRQRLAFPVPGRHQQWRCHQPMSQTTLPQQKRVPGPPVGSLSSSGADCLLHLSCWHFQDQLVVKRLQPSTGERK